MHALIVVAHPDPKSLTHAVAARIAEAGAGHAVEIADLAAEGFDPRFSAADLAAYHKRAPMPADVTAEQARVDRASDLVLVYPVYWWSMPGLLKGWIDRVFTNGWAYDSGPDVKLVKKLRRLRVHLVGVGGADSGTYERHGYFGAMKLQIDHGIFDFCGAPVATSEFLLDVESKDGTLHLEKARTIGHQLFDATPPSDVSKAA
jgi:NAD(P)H dehydrogenase (quinone)